MRRVSSGVLYYDDVGYRFCCRECSKLPWVGRIVRGFRHWKVFPDQLGPFNQGCGYCEENTLNPGRSCDLFTSGYLYSSLPKPDYFLKPRRNRAR